MILADSSVWISHLRGIDSRLTVLLNRGEILMHPFVIGELAMGSLSRREAWLKSLSELPPCAVAKDSEVRAVIEAYRLYGSGLGYVDAHLLAATKLSGTARLWSTDKRLDAAAKNLNLAWPS
jgi:predicted nucleic acid-binding protein